MKADTVKAAAVAIAFLGVGWIIFNSASRLKRAGDSLSKLPGDIAQKLTDLVSNASQAAGDAITGATGQASVGWWNTKKSAMGLVGATPSSAEPSPSNPDWVAPDYVTELPFKKWPQSAKNAINMLNKQRGITRTWVFEGDFSGWHVYSNGAIMSPDGYYMRDLIAQGEAPSTGAPGEATVIALPDSFSGLTFDQTKYQWQLAQENN